MKVCVVTTWPPHRDGVALYSAELYTKMAKLFDIRVFANIPKEQTLTNWKESEVIVTRCWKRGPWYPMHIFRSVLKTNCHIIHLQHGWLLYGSFVSSLLFPLLLVLLRFSHKPCIVTLHTVIRRDANIFTNPVTNFLARIAILFISRCILQFSKEAIVHNHLMKKILQSEFGVKNKKITLIPHGVKKAVEKTKSTKKDEKLCILSLGFLRKGKGFESLIEAFKSFLEECPDSKLVIVGGSHAHDKTGHLKDFKDLLTPELQKKITFTGFIDDTNLQQLIWESDMIVLQSKETYYVEVSGALAAVADYGKPVICSRVPKFQSELRHGKDCILVSPSNSKVLTQALILLKNNRKLRNRLGRNLKEKFKNRHWTKIAEEHVTLYRSVMKTLKIEDK